MAGVQVKEVYSEALGVSSGLGLMMVRIGAGMTTGTLAILAAQPTDVVKVTFTLLSNQKYFIFTDKLLNLVQMNFTLEL